jgi:hypothetical protein
MLLPDLVDFVKRLNERHDNLRNGYKTLLSLEQKKCSEFLKVISAILMAYDFGDEWRETLIAFVLTGSFCPPILNLYIDKLPVEPIEMQPDKARTDRILLDPAMPEKIKKLTAKPRMMRYKSRMILHLNPDTSIEDIENAWPTIKQSRGELRPRFKAINLTKNSFWTLSEQIRLRAEKQFITDKEKYSAFSYYEKQLLKQGHPMREVLGYRSGIKQGGGKSLRKSIKIKQKRTDADFIKQTRPGIKKNDIRKAVNRLRQQRSRMLKR